MCCKGVVHPPSTYKTASLLPESRSHTPTKRPTCLAQGCQEPRHPDYCSLLGASMIASARLELQSLHMLPSTTSAGWCGRGVCICCCAAVKLALAAAIYVFGMHSAARLRAAAALAVQLMILCLLTGPVDDSFQQGPAVAGECGGHSHAVEVEVQLRSCCILWCHVVTVLQIAWKDYVSHVSFFHISCGGALLLLYYNLHWIVYDNTSPRFAQHMVLHVRVTHVKVMAQANLVEPGICGPVPPTLLLGLDVSHCFAAATVAFVASASSQYQRPALAAGPTPIRVRRCAGIWSRQARELSPSVSTWACAM